MSALANHAFAKMNGIGNEIVVVDLRDKPATVSAEEARAVAAPAGVAFDQLMVLQPPLIFPISVRDNLTYGRPEATQREIEHAARLADAGAAAIADGVVARDPEYGRINRQDGRRRGVFGPRRGWRRYGCRGDVGPAGGGA